MTSHEQKGFTVWFTGLSGAGKSTLAEMLYHELRKREMKVEMLDGDIIRTNLSKGLGFSKEDRDTNILRIGFVSQLLTRNGVAVIVSAWASVEDRVVVNVPVVSVTPMIVPKVLSNPSADSCTSWMP